MGQMAMRKVVQYLFVVMRSWNGRNVKSLFLSLLECSWLPLSDRQSCPVLLTSFQGRQHQRSDSNYSRVDSDKLLSIIIDRWHRPVFEPIGAHPENYRLGIRTYDGWRAVSTVLDQRHVAVSGQIRNPKSEIQMHINACALRGSSPEPQGWMQPGFW
jgi:hypothetical protein